MLELWGASWWNSRTHRNPPLCPKCLWTFLLGHLVDLCVPFSNGGLKWINLKHWWLTVLIINEPNFCSEMKRKLSALSSLLTTYNQTCRAVESNQKYRLVFFSKRKFLFLYDFVFVVVVVLLPSLHCSSCYFYRKLIYFPTHQCLYFPFVLVWNKTM